jgi:hypothetical protein
MAHPAAASEGGCKMKITVDDEEAKLLLNGIYKSSRTTSFRIDPVTGEHHLVNVTKEYTKQKI